MVFLSGGRLITKSSIIETPTSDRASLKNALNAVAGLFVIVLYLYKDKANERTITSFPTITAG